jgi:hypothetical protein
MIKTDAIGTIEIIEINWEGPFKITSIGEKCNEDYDYGIYQVYGTHNVYGPKTLLYIGKAQDRTFAKRFSEHKEWIEWEPASIEIYIGRLGGNDKMTESKWDWWSNQIDRAERLLIFYCSPPYNSKGLNHYGEMDPTIVLNYGKSMRLPFEASNLDNFCSIGTPEWTEYGKM